MTCSLRHYSFAGQLVWIWHWTPIGNESTALAALYLGMTGRRAQA